MPRHPAPLGAAPLAIAAVATAGCLQPLGRAPLHSQTLTQAQRVAGEIGEIPLVDVHGVARFRDGTLAIGVAAESAVLLVNPDGTLRGRFLRRGAGPGEVTYVLELTPAGDSVLVQRSDGRVHLFNRAGELIASAVRTTLPSGWSFVRALAYREPGRWVVLGGRLPVGSSGVDTAWYGLFDGVDGRARPVQTFIGRTRTAAVPNRKRIPLFAPEGTAVANRDGVCWGYPAADLIECEWVDGTRRRFSPGFPRPRITRAHVAIALAAELAGNTRDTARVHRAIREDYRTRPVATISPAYGLVRLGRDSTVWVSEWFPQLGLIGPPHDRAPSGPLRWAVFSRDGRRTMTVTTPARFVPTDVASDAIAGMEYDRDGVESVVVYRINR
jgi:hypothetical protein